jgi:lipopolysaccharide export system protein LptA
VRKYVLSFCLLLIAASVLGQKKSIVTLIRSQSSTGIKLQGKDVIKVYKGTFKQDYSTLTSDSAYFYPDQNAFDAFGHVNINQGDTLNIYGDKLNYNGNTKVAVLTDNVKMVDKDATLTTNHLNYNTATRIATYTDGGKLVNKDNTLLSKNGFYFAFTRDSYFRYDVSLTTPDALVKTDTMRYNTGTKISYFYGPTNIYSVPKKGEKNTKLDTLYTENGDYNTVNEQARFGKNNLYHSGPRSLKGDSLFYDKIKGYGRAVKHVTFADNEQKTVIKGNLGTYFKSQELTIMTEDPYVIMVTEQKDTTKTDSVAKVDSIAQADSLKKLKPKNKSAMTMAQIIKTTMPGKTDTLSSNQKNNLLKAINSKTDTLSAGQKNNLLKAIPLKIDTSKLSQKNIRSKMDSAIRKLPTQNKGGTAKNALAKNAAAIVKNKTGGKVIADTPAAPKDTSKIKRDSIYMSADTIETQILTYKDLKIYQEKQRLAHIRDTTAKSKKPKEKESKFLSAESLRLPPDTNFYHHNYFGPPKPKPVKKKIIKPLSKKQLEQDSLRKKEVADSIITAKKLEPSDTARIRIIIAHHHFKMFKSDLQAKSDSMFYSNSDSTIRCYVKPMMWTEGSQLSGDTIYLQMKNKTLDNLRAWPNAFIVNIEKTDSVHFNQIAGKRMRGYFKDDKLYRMFVEGNAESIYFSRDSGKMTISGMQRSLSSRIRVDFKNNQATNLAFYVKPENRYGPLSKFKEDDKILKGFIWKPKDRPVSKESIIPSFNKKATDTAKVAADKSKTGGPPLKKIPGAKTAKNSASKANAAKPGLKTAGDNSKKTTPGNLPGLKTRGDSIVMKANVLKLPAINAAKDTAKHVPVKVSVIQN